MLYINGSTGSAVTLDALGAVDVHRGCVGLAQGVWPKAQGKRLWLRAEI
jgi:hypothetical protein